MIIPQTKTKENIFNEQNLKTILQKSLFKQCFTDHLEDFKNLLIPNTFRGPFK